MLNIIVIKKNNSSFDELTYDDIMGSKLTENLKTIVNVILIKNNTQDIMLENIVNEINCPSETNYKTYKCFETKDTIFYHTYVQDDDKSDGNNFIGRLISDRHEPVNGNSVLWCIKKQIVCDADFGDFVDIIRSKFIHKCLSIDTEGNKKKIIYHENPIENSGWKDESCVCVHVEFLNKFLCVFMERKPLDHKINKLATILCKKMGIYGNVVVSMLNSYPSVECTDLDEGTLNKIMCVLTHTSTMDLSGIVDQLVHNNFNDILDRLSRKYDNQIDDNIPDDVLNGQSYNSALSI